MQPSVGGRIVRPEGPDKVTGRARYVADLHFEGEWWGAALRSSVARGELRGLTLDPSFDFARVALVLPQDVPGDNCVAMIADDQPVLAARSIEHVGEPLALVAAPTRELLAAAVAAIHVDVAPLEPLLDPRASSRVFKEITITKGDAPLVLARASRVFEGEYRTDTQEQMYIEPQGVIALPPDERGGVTVHGSLQCPYYVQRAVARCMGIEPALARVIQAATGGGFGGKEDYPSVLACHAALLARASGHPVRMIFERHEDLLVTPKRHPSIVRHRTAVDPDGRLLAMEIDVLLDGGAYTTLSPVVLSRACIHAAGPYRCDNVTIRGRAVATNHVPYGAFRGFGAPQTCFAVERQMDRIAAGLGLQPFELRRQSALGVGDTTATGQRLSTSVGSEAVLARLAPHVGRAAARGRSGSGTRARGFGVSFFFHGSGFTGAGEQHLRGVIAVELAPDGRALVRSASTEFGQGTQTMFRAIAADALGGRPEDVEIALVDTDAVPDSGPTVASRTCMIVGGVLARACRELAQRVGGEGAFRERARSFVAGGGDARVEALYQSPPGLQWDDETYSGDAYPAYGWGADLAEVEVDLDTFEVRVTRFTSAVDVGRAIQPQMVIGQVEGGSLQAIGFAHLEAVTNVGGRVAQDRMSTCIVPTTLDAPEFEVELVEIPFEHGPFGAKGVGEMPMDGGAPAVLAAIEDALGVHLAHLPATPERILEAWLAAHPEQRL